MAESVTKWESAGGNNTKSIGGNGYEFSYTDKEGKVQYLQVDYGSMFADKEKTGLECYLPDIPKANDILITHGHMDHVGGIPHLINLRRGKTKEPLTLHCSKYSEQMIRNSLTSSRIPAEEFPIFHTIEPGKEFEVNGFKVEPFSVSHSIPEASGFVVESPDGVRMMTMGDFKTAPVPLGNGWDDEAVAKIAKKGIDFMFVDSTSASSPGYSKGENQVREGLKDVLKESEGGMIVSAMISSSAHRLHTVATAVANYAKETGTEPRTVIIDGASLINARRALVKCGYNIEEMVKEQTGIDIKIATAGTKTAENVPYDQRFYVCTGTQGEEASFVKVAEGRNKNISLDVPCPVHVYNLQSCIPGNEEQYKGLEQKFKDKGCTTYFPDRYKPNKITVHASGHSGAGDVAHACHIVHENSPRPTKVVPIHGATEQRKKVMEIAQDEGMNTFLVRNFSAISIDSEGRATFEKAAPLEKWITVKDLNNDFRKPYYEYATMMMDIPNKKVIDGEKIYYKKPPKKQKPEEKKINVEKKLQQIAISKRCR